MRELSAKLTEGENFSPPDQYTRILLGNFGQYPNCKFLLPLISWILSHSCAIHLFCLLRCIVSSAVKFNDYSRLGTIKVRDIISNRFLPLKAHRIVTQKVIPQFPFPRSHIFPQHLCQRDILFVIVLRFLSLRLAFRRATSLVRGRLFYTASFEKNPIFRSTLVLTPGTLPLLLYCHISTL